MTTLSPVRALILDLGNVLIFHDNDKLYRELAVACRCEPDDIVNVLRNEEIGRVINTTDGGASLVYETVAPAIGFPGDFAAFKRIWNGIFTPNESIAPVIATLRGHVRLLVLSNTNAMHMDFIRPRLPVLDCIDTVLASHELGLVKPDVAIYKAALAAAGTSPDETAFFDDLQGHVDGARAAGIRGFLFTDTRAFVRDLNSLGLLPREGT
jgi:FMN phosphatase YigB (HAD superfamily)